MDQCCINVRRIRKSQGVSLRSLSERTGLSVSFLSNFENGKVNITLSALRSIAKSLNVSIKTLLTNEEDSTILVVPRNKRYSIISKNEDGAEAFVQDFLTRGSNFDMQVTVVHLKGEQSNGSPDCHDGQEFVYIIEGSIELHFNHMEKITLSAGDMAYYDAHVPHNWSNPGDKDATFLAVANKTGF